MPYKVPVHPAELQRAPSPEDLRRVFEKAVREIHQAEISGNKRLQYHASIVPRSRLLGISQAGLEKRALSDAARALARLWRCERLPG
jgi:hypothetical protein